MASTCHHFSTTLHHILFTFLCLARRSLIYQYCPLLVRRSSGIPVHLPKGGYDPREASRHTAERLGELQALREKASKLLGDEESGAKNCSACVETPRCLRHGTTHARNSKIEKAHMCFMIMAVHVAVMRSWLGQHERATEICRPRKCALFARTLTARRSRSLNRTTCGWGVLGRYGELCKVKC